jgi:hypothetical protein
MVLAPEPIQGAEPLRVSSYPPPHSLFPPYQKGLSWHGVANFKIKRIPQAWVSIIISGWVITVEFPSLNVSSIVHTDMTLFNLIKPLLA